MPSSRQQPVIPSSLRTGLLLHWWLRTRTHALLPAHPVLAVLGLTQVKEKCLLSHCHFLQHPASPLIQASVHMVNHQAEMGSEGAPQVPGGFKKHSSVPFLQSSQHRAPPCPGRRSSSFCLSWHKHFIIKHMSWPCNREVFGEHFPLKWALVKVTGPTTFLKTESVLVWVPVVEILGKFKIINLLHESSLGHIFKSNYVFQPHKRLRSFKPRCGYLLAVSLWSSLLGLLSLVCSSVV